MARGKRRKAKQKEIQMADFHGTPLTGTPNSTAPEGIPHSRARYDKDGNLKIQSMPLTVAVIDGRQRTIWVEVPPALQDHYSADDPGSADFIPTVFGDQPGQLTLGPGNVVTMNGYPDIAPSFVQVDWTNKKPGWTQDPQIDPVTGKHGDQAAKYVASFDSNGDPVFGDPPVATAAAGGSAQAQFMADVQNALGRFVAAQK